MQLTGRELGEEIRKFLKARLLYTDRRANSVYVFIRKEKLLTEQKNVNSKSITYFIQSENELQEKLEYALGWVMLNEKDTRFHAVVTKEREAVNKVSTETLEFETLLDAKRYITKDIEKESYKGTPHETKMVVDKNRAWVLAVSDILHLRYLITYKQVSKF